MSREANAEQARPRASAPPCAEDVARCRLDIRLPPTLEARFEATTEVAADAGWRAARAVLDDDLERLVEGVRAVRRCASSAVAGSLFVLDYSRRLGWPVLDAHLRRGAWLDPGRHNVRLSPNATGLPQVGFVIGPERGSRRDVGEVVDALVADHLAHLVEAVHRATGVGRRTLWGNVAVALTQVFMAFSWASDDRDRFLTTARQVVADRSPLRGTVLLESVEHRDQEWMVVWRRSCCLAFRTEPAAPRSYCGTCCVLEHGERVASFRRAADRYVEIERSRS
ncbi:FhuF/siderophore biosynthesis protein [Pseudonocardia dioxanivorans CB1190]|uniref:FhuF/siderophore biosynthesis protein n=1 Tax=Pseudonocardia dioxanivorans (strain ATCC 55486 / DSM 44775 / JCM 13855 / CB1190) TaxID=675635 RepID=F4CLH8_PSEUX|nr:FhuF/siderophore biosynthesis protein [Pseudonocardia dioxanivorans CB1190]